MMERRPRSAFPDVASESSWYSKPPIERMPLASKIFPRDPTPKGMTLYTPKPAPHGTAKFQPYDQTVAEANRTSTAVQTDFDKIRSRSSSLRASDPVLAGCSVYRSQDYGPDPELQRPLTRPGDSLFDSAGEPLFRTGRGGSSWRHIRQCIGNLGNVIVFLDGDIKTSDCRRFPPAGYPSDGPNPSCRIRSAAASFRYYCPKQQAPMAISRQTRQPLTVTRGPVGRKVNYDSSIERARAGQRYWPEDSRHIKLLPTTIQGRIMKTGTAY